MFCAQIHSMQLAVSRFRAIEKTATDKGNDIKVHDAIYDTQNLSFHCSISWLQRLLFFIPQALAENDYETELAASVVRAKDIGIRFDQIGALDDVKTTLKELIILPLKRPELFSKGNLRKVLKDTSLLIWLHCK